MDYDTFDYVFNFLSFRAKIKVLKLCPFMLEYGVRDTVFGKVVLSPDQLYHFVRLFVILKTNPFAVDVSPMGCGKTFITLAMAEQTRLDIIVICPASAEYDWNYRMSTMSNVKGMVMSYESMRGVREGVLKHGLLERKKIIKRDKEGNPRTTIKYEQTAKLIAILNRGVLIIFDEAHALKNTTLQSKAAKALTQSMSSYKRSRCLLLSASLFDREHHSINYLKLLGFIKQYKKICVKNSDGITFQGLQEAIDAAMEIDPVKTTEILSSNVSLSVSSITEMACKLFVEVLRTKIFSTMPPVKPSFKGEHLVRNLYLNLSEVDYNLLVIGVRELGSAARFDPITGVINTYARPNFGGITNALVKIERAKTNAIIRAAKTILDNKYLKFEPTADVDLHLREVKRKVIIYFNYKENVEKARELLLEYDPIILSGDVIKIKRAKLIHEFQNNPDKRVLITILAVGKSSISLDHQSNNGKENEGNRVAFATPDYRLTDLYQAEGRIRRKNTISTSEHNYVYGKKEGQNEGIDILEKKIYEALAKKASTLSSVNSFESCKSIKYPGEHPNIYEQ